MRVTVINDLLGMDTKALPDLYAYRLEPGFYLALEEIVDVSGLKIPFITVVNGNPGRVWGCAKSIFEMALKQGSARIKESEV